MLKGLTTEQKRMLLILTLINFVNYIDRQVIYPLFHLIKAEFNISDFQLGLLGTAFLLVHSLASLPLGVLADKYSRKTVIAIGVAFWSIASFAGGLVTSFKQLLVTRSLVGVGEASYAPAATAIVSDNFPEALRARAQGVFNIGMFVGGTLGAMIGGVIAYYSSNWRLAFFIVSLPGIILAFAAFKIKDTKLIHPKENFLKVLLRNPAYCWILVSGTFAAFASGAYITWGVEFISRYKGYNLRDTAIGIGTLFVVAGVLGSIIGSWLADYFQKRVVWGRSAVVGVSLILAAPFLLFGFQDTHNNILLFGSFFIGTLLFSAFQGPVTAVIHDVVPKHLHATGFALYVLVIHLLGETGAPAIIGKISDHADLKTGMELATITVLLSGLTFLPICWLLSKKRVVLEAE